MEVFFYPLWHDLTYSYTLYKLHTRVYVTSARLGSTVTGWVGTGTWSKRGENSGNFSICMQKYITSTTHCVKVTISACVCVCDCVRRIIDSFFPPFSLHSYTIQQNNSHSLCCNLKSRWRHWWIKQFLFPLWIINNTLHLFPFPVSRHMKKQMKIKQINIQKK